MLGRGLSAGLEVLEAITPRLINRTDDRYELLYKFQGLLKALGFSGIVVLVDRVEDARDSQQHAKEQFKDALERDKLVAAYESAAHRLGRDVARAVQRANDAPVNVVV